MTVWEWLYQRSHWWGPDGILRRLAQHAELVGLGLAVAVGMGLAIGWVGRRSRNVGGFAQLIAVGAACTLALQLPQLLSWQAAIGLGVMAAVPVARATADGFSAVDPSARAAAERLGLSGWQVLGRLELPAARGHIVRGVRGAAVGLAGTSVLVAYAGVGGFGRYVVDGAAAGDTARQQAGIVLVVASGIALWLLVRLVEHWVTPRSLRLRRQRRD